MKVDATRRMLLLTLALSVGGARLALADSDDDDDHDKAGRAVEQGQAKPLAEILEAVRARLAGEIIGVKFKQKDGRYIYKLKLVTRTGQLQEVSVDAATGDIIKSGGD